jgi:hypothetical protein
MVNSVIKAALVELGNDVILLTVDVDNLTGIFFVFLQMVIVHYWLQYMNPYS